MNKTFVKMAKEKFDFLIREYNFNIISFTESPRAYKWEGEVEYGTKSTYLSINCVREEKPVLNIGRKKDTKKNLIPLNTIYQFYTLSEDEKKIVFSHSLTKENEGRVSEILRTKNLLNLIPKANTLERTIEFTLSCYVENVLRYAKPFLLGDFSQWPNIFEYRVEKLRAEHVRSGKNEFIEIVERTDEGKFRVIGRKSVFQSSLDYLEQLRIEKS